MEFNNKQQYAAPALMLVGDAQDTILGAWSIGPDMWGETIFLTMEFGEDPAPNA